VGVVRCSEVSMHCLAGKHSSSAGAHLQIGKVNIKDTSGGVLGRYASSFATPVFGFGPPHAKRKPKTLLIAKSFARFLHDFSKIHGDLH